MIYYKVTYSKQREDGLWKMHNDAIMADKDVGNILLGNVKGKYVVLKLNLIR